MNIQGTTLHVSFSKKVAVKKYDEENEFYSVALDARIDNLSPDERKAVAKTLFDEARQAVAQAIAESRPGMSGTMPRPVQQHIESQAQKTQRPTSPSSMTATAGASKANPATPDSASPAAKPAASAKDGRKYTFRNPKAKALPGQLKAWEKLRADHAELVKKNGGAAATLETATGVDSFKDLTCVDASEAINTASAVMANLRKELAAKDPAPTPPAPAAPAPTAVPVQVQNSPASKPPHSLTP